MTRDRTSYVVTVTFDLVGRYDGERSKRVIVGRFHEKSAARMHGSKVLSALRELEWITNVEVAVETVWHLRSGKAAAQLVHDIFHRSPWIEPSRQGPA